MSIAGSIGSSIWSYSPLLGIGLAAGATYGAVAGTRSFLNTQGSIPDKAEAARDSSIRGGILVTGGVLGALTIANTGGRPLGMAAGKFARGIPGFVGNYAAGMKQDFLLGRATKSGFMSGIGAGTLRVAERPMVSAGIGGIVGAAIGHAIDRDHPNRGAVIGAAAGAAGGVAISAGLRGFRTWSKLGGFGKVGIIGALGVTAFGVTAAMNSSKQVQVDVAQPQDSGLNSRMSSMNATGDLVFGLHRSR